MSTTSSAYRRAWSVSWLASARSRPGGRSTRATGPTRRRGPVRQSSTRLSRGWKPIMVGTAASSPSGPLTFSGTRSSVVVMTPLFPRRRNASTAKAELWMKIGHGNKSAGPVERSLGRNQSQLPPPDQRTTSIGRMDWSASVASTGGGLSLPGADCGLGGFEFFEQFGEHSYLAGLPVRDERREPVQANLGQPVQLGYACRGEHHQVGAPVRRIPGDVNVAGVRQLPELPGDEGRMDA